MAVPLKARAFNTFEELSRWVADPANNVTTIIDRVADKINNKIWVFYT